MAEVLSIVTPVHAKISATVPVDADLLGKLTTISITRAPTMVTTTYIGNSAYDTEAPTITKITGTAEGNVDFANAPQQLLFTALKNRTIVYISVTDDAAAAEDAHKGWTYPFYVSNGEDSFEPAALRPFNFSLSLAAAPVEILGAAP